MQVIFTDEVYKRKEVIRLGFMNATQTVSLVDHDGSLYPLLKSMILHLEELPFVKVDEFIKKPIFIEDFINTVRKYIIIIK